MTTVPKNITGVELCAGTATLWAGRDRRAIPEHTLADELYTLSGSLIVAGAEGAPELSVPCKPLELPLLPVQMGTLSGIGLPSILQATPADRLDSGLLRIIGFLSLNPDWDGVLCLPGAMTHWVHISAAEIVSFQSFATRELLTAARTGGLSGSCNDGWDEAVFADTVNAVMSRPEKVAALIASVRLGGADDGLSRVTGALIGAELAGARPYWLGQQVAVLGDADVNTRAYTRALTIQGVPVIDSDGDAMTRAGIAAVAGRMDR